MKHPNPEMQKNQENFLNQCPEKDRAFHEQLFRIGNAAYVYHQQAQTENKVTEEYFYEWLEGLPQNVRKVMENKGFEACKSVLSFTRYVNERSDIGMDDWMKKYLSEDDFNAWKMSNNVS